jgi:glycosyltransferase involved in cell wall biosynthesis
MIAGSPAASIIVPCRNEASSIEACLRSILSQEPLSGRFEVIVADGMSSDGTREKVIAFAQADDRVRMIDNPHRVTPSGLNLAITAARAPVIIRMDAHTEYPPDYVRRCLATLEETEADNVGGVWEIVPAHNGPMATAIARIQGHWFGVGSATYRISDSYSGPADTVPYGCFRRSVFEKVGMFDERLIRGQDLEMNARIRKQGGVIWLDGSIRCFYHPPSTWRNFVVKQFRNGQWVVYQAFLASPGSLSVRHSVPLGFVLALLFGAGLMAFYPVAGALILVAAGLPYLLLMSYAVFQLVRKPPRKAGLIYPFLLLSNHLGYGLGSLWGLLTIPRLWCK